MDWGDTLAQLALAGAKTLATAAGGPLAGNMVEFVGNKLLGKPDATPDEVKQALQGLTGDQVVQLKKLELEYKAHLADQGIVLETKRIDAEAANTTAVNTTMQAEAAAEHWPTYSWRPAIGFTVAFDLFVGGLAVIACYAPAFIGGAPNAAAVAALPTALTALSALSATALPILGIASWFRGKMQADPTVPTDNRG